LASRIAKHSPGGEVPPHKWNNELRIDHPLRVEEPDFRGEWRSPLALFSEHPTERGHQTHQSQYDALKGAIANAKAEGLS
jgi:hypothetical protein